MNPHFSPKAAFTHTYIPLSLGYADDSSAQISACGTKNSNAKINHIGIAATPSPKESEVDFAIHLIPNRAEIFTKMRAFNLIFFIY